MKRILQATIRDCVGVVSRKSNSKCNLRVGDRGLDLLDGFCIAESAGPELKAERFKDSDFGGNGRV